LSAFLEHCPADKQEGFTTENWWTNQGVTFAQNKKTTLFPGGFVWLQISFN
jgi:hypothetical protein